MQLPYRKPGKFSQTPFDPLITQDKFYDLSRRLDKLKKQQPKAATEVAHLAELGDFSENMEYQQAKGRLRWINNQILILERQLTEAEIISSNGKKDIVEIGATVTITDGKKLKSYQILGSTETNPEQGIISHISPIGAALLDHKVGDNITVIIGKTNRQYTITQIS